MNKKELYELSINLIVSAGIGLVVGLIEIALMHMNQENGLLLLRDMSIGAAVGTVARYLFILVFFRLQDVVLSFIVMFIAIGTLSSLPFVYFTLIGEQHSVLNTVLIVLAAEAMGMSLGYISYRKCDKMNNKLNEKKKEF